MPARENHGREGSVLPVLVAMVIGWLDRGLDAGARSIGRELHEISPRNERVRICPFLSIPKQSSL